MSDELHVVFETGPKTSAAVEYAHPAKNKNEILAPLTERERIAILAITSALRALVTVQFPIDHVTERIANPLIAGYHDITGRDYVDDYRTIWK